MQSEHDSESNVECSVGSVVSLSGDVLSPCPGPGLAWSLGQMVFTIQWQPQRLTQEDQILDMEDQREANTAVTSGSENLVTVYRSCFSDTMQ